MTVCTDAPVGTYVAKPGANRWAKCPAGTYQPSTGTLYCQLCPAGFSSNEMASACIACPTGACVAGEGGGGGLCLGSGEATAPDSH